MKKLGLIGGIGPESTLVYYKDIIEKYRSINQNGTYPKIIIDSLDLSKIYSLVENKNWELFTKSFVDSLKNLAAGGAEFAAMTANTAHIVYDDVAKQSPLPVISIVEETCKYTLSENCKNVIIFGTAFTMSSGLYSDAFLKHGINAFVPTEDEQKLIHNIIFPNLQEGIILEEDKAALLKVANRMIEDKNADALILACTELPSIIKENDLNVKVLDTTKIHIDSILEYMID